MKKAALAAAFLVVTLVAPAGARSTPPPALPAATGGSTQGVTPSGMMYSVTPDPAQPAAAVALWYRAPASGFGAVPSAGLSRVAALTVAASAPITGTPLARLAQELGARLTIEAYPDSVSITVLVSPEHVARIVRAMTADYFAPVTDAAGLALAQHDAAEDGLYRSYDATDAVEDAVENVLFSSGPFHDGTIAAPKAVAALTLDDVRAYAERAFRPANAVLVLTGKVTPSAVTEAATRDGATLSAEPLVHQSVAVPDAPARRSASIAATGLGWAGPAIDDEVAATSLDFIADMLFSPQSGSVQRSLGSLDAKVSGTFVTYHDPGLFVVTISGADAQAALPLVRRAIAQAAVPLSPAAFAAARAGFAYRLLSDMETPEQLADTFGWYAVEGNLPYAPAGDRYFHVAAGLTPQVVARMAARFLGAAPAIVTLVPARTPTPAPVKQS
jgi:predicted Zn-dependent peptidase